MRNCKHLILLLILIPTISFADLASIGSNLVEDDTNSLIWIRHTIGPKKWQDASDYADALTYASYSDWRLPTRTELQYLLVLTRSPQISPLFNLGSPSRWVCWTSEEITDSSHILSDRAYLFSFTDGNSYTASKLSSHSFLLVQAITLNSLIDSDGETLFDVNGEQLLGATP